jgi:hypothetical protein
VALSDPSNRHSSRGTLRLDAAFIPDDADDQFDMTELVGNLGVGMQGFPGVLVPSGGASPGYPFVEIGDFRTDEDDGGEGPSSDGMSSPLIHSDTAEKRQAVRPVAPSPGFKASQREGDTQDGAINAAFIGSTTPVSYPHLSDLVRQAVPEPRCEVPSGISSAGDNTRDLPEDMFVAPIRSEQTRVDEATSASSPSGQGVEVTLPDGQTVPDDLPSVAT